MKKLIIALLITATLLSACNNDSDSSYTSSDTEDGISTETSENTDMQSPEDTAYTDIACYSTYNYTSSYFLYEGSSQLIRLKCPTDWVFTKKTDTLYIITRDGREIGKLFTDSVSDLDEWKTVKQEQSQNGSLLCQSNIEKYGTNDTLSFRYRFSFSHAENGTTRKITLIADYAEISKQSSHNFLYQSSLKDEDRDTCTNTLSHIKGGSVIILGNSFINSSKIGSILTEMVRVNGKKLNVKAVSRGYATVETYINDVSMMTDIRNGSYDAVFICGFYSSSEIDNLGILKTACDSSNTDLIIFPAHNENSSAVRSAKSKYEDLLLLNWKAELNALIEGGISKWDLCINDQHSHSNPLAGYVGAHMIYRAVFGALPTYPVSNTIDQTYVNSVLGNYIERGYALSMDENELYYIK